MFSFFKNKSEVPAWASFFDGNEYSKFMSEVDSYFKTKHWKYTHKDGVIELATNDMGFEKLGLSNLAQVCKAHSTKKYRELIVDHFETMVKSKEFDNHFETIVHDYEQIKQYIGIRIYAFEYVDYLGREFTVGKVLGDDLYAMLVFDLPFSIINVHPTQADKWNKPLDDLYTIGIQNIQKNYPITITQFDLPDFQIQFAQGDHFFAPNVVFGLENNKKLHGTHGALLGIPHRHAVLIYPIEDIQVLHATNTLAPIVMGMHSEGPGSVSPNLFWYKDGHFENIPYKINNEKIEITPSEKFVDLLNFIAE